jgi:diguanylate cyclase (GGDEF)-like protein
MLMTFEEAPAPPASVQAEPSSRLRSLDIEAEAERLLAGRTRDIRLRGALLSRYQHWSWPRRAKIVRGWMVWVAALNILLTALAALVLSDAFTPNLLAVVLVVPLINGGVYGLWRRPRGPWIEPLSLVAVTITTVICYGVIGIIFGAQQEERYLTAALFLATIALIVFDMTLPWSVAMGILALLVFAAFQRVNPTVGLSETVFAVTFFGSGIFATLAARRTSNILAYKGFLLTVRDAQHRRALAEANRNLHRLATLDPLTGIANRRSVKAHTDRLWRDAAVDKGQVAVIMADIDHFKRLNDTFGHAAGDACIRQVADAMVASTRRGLDLVSRYGGEEFMVVLTDAPDETTMLIAERIRSAVEALEIEAPGVPTGVLAVTLSLGVAMAKDGVGAELLGNRADDALYEAKRRGRNRVCRWPVEPAPQTARRA